MKKKGFVQSCEIAGMKKRSTGKKVSPNHRSVGKNDLVNVYNRFYREQVADLYRAVNGDD